MKQYLDTLKLVYNHGHIKQDRTGVGTLSIFSPPDMVFDLTQTFPLVTTKKIFTKGVVAELLWMLSGSTNSKILEDQGVNIWKEWSDEKGDLGPIYGKQWRNWSGQGIDQITELVKGLTIDPASRRHIVSAWNVSELPWMALAPCHCFFQCYVHDDGYLDLKLYQRSADLFLGVPFNIASYALLTHMLARAAGLKPGRFIHSLGDAHIYSNHITQVETQLKREPLQAPTLWLNPHVKSIFDYKMEDIVFKDYISHEPIKGEVAV